MLIKSGIIEVYELERPQDMDEVGAMQDFARKVFGELKELPVQAMIRCADGKLLALSPDPEIDKHVFVEVLRNFARQKCADLAILCMEVWYADGKEEDARRPSERPDRKEGVVVFSESPTGSVMSVAQITRDGEACELGEFNSLAPDSIGGAMTRLLPTN